MDNCVDSLDSVRCGERVGGIAEDNLGNARQFGSVSRQDERARTR